MDQKPHWLITELAAVCVVGLILYLGWIWQSSGSLESVKVSAKHYYYQKNYAAAIPLYERLKAGIEGSDKRDSKDYAEVLANLADAYYNNNQEQKAMPLLEKVLSLQEKLLTTDSPYLARTLEELAYCLRLDKKYSESIALYQRVIAIRKKRQDASGTASALEGLSDVYLVQENYKQSIEAAERARKVRGQSIYSDSGSDRARNLAICYERTKSFDKAELLYRDILNYRQRSSSATEAEKVQATKDLVDCLKAQGKTDDAKELEDAKSESTSEVVESQSGSEDQAVEQSSNGAGSD
jgi:tetratricopeptide (TPR) repeat protein